jgi:hypothetical protein
LVPVRDALIAQRRAELVDEMIFRHGQQRLRPLVNADRSRFTEPELCTIREVVASLKGQTGEQVSELSHEEQGWKDVKDGETIPYGYALVGFPQVVTPAASARAKELQAELAHKAEVKASGISPSAGPTAP